MLGFLHRRYSCWLDQLQHTLSPALAGSESAVCDSPARAEFCSWLGKLWMNDCRFPSVITNLGYRSGLILCRCTHRPKGSVAVSTLLSAPLGHLDPFSEGDLHPLHILLDRLRIHPDPSRSRSCVYVIRSRSVNLLIWKAPITGKVSH